MKEIKRSEIYFASLDPVKGCEQGGTRPVLILQNEMGNEYSPMTIVAPITKRRKKKLPTHVKVCFDGTDEKRTVLLEQMRAIDKSRLTEYIDKLDKKSMAKIDRAIVVSLGIKIRRKKRP